MKTSLYSIVAITALYSCSFALLSCTREKVTPIDPTCTSTISFSNEVMPIIQANCIGCHDQGNASGGYDLSSYASISTNANAVVGSMKGSGYQFMPQGGTPIPDSLIQKINCWIQQGKQDN